ncbi:hypothetical protein ACFL0X_00515 [Nanoarchaeota archaeon]
MEKITIDIPEDVAFISNVPSLNWSLVVTKMLQLKLEELAKLKKITSESKLTEKDVDELTNKINESMSKRY